MEQVFKTKRARRWWIIIVSLVVLIIFLNVYLEKSWAFSALGGIIIPVLMFYSRHRDDALALKVPSRPDRFQIGFMIERWFAQRHHAQN